MREILRTDGPHWLFTYDDFAWEYFSWDKNGVAKNNLKGPGVRCIHAPSKSRCVSSFKSTTHENRVEAFELMRRDANFQRWWKHRVALSIIEARENTAYYPLNVVGLQKQNLVFFAYHGILWEEINPSSLAVFQPNEDMMPFEKNLKGGRIVSPMGGPVG